MIDENKYKNMLIDNEIYQVEQQFNNDIKEILDEVRFELTFEKWLEPLGFNKESWKLLLDYITNLQEENGRLKEIENFKFSLRKHETKILPTVTKNYKSEYEDYKSRNEKAIEYIEERKNLSWYADGVFVYELLNILQGSDDNGKNNNCM